MTETKSTIGEAGVANHAAWLAAYGVGLIAGVVPGLLFLFAVFAPLSAALSTSITVIALVILVSGALGAFLAGIGPWPSGSVVSGIVTGIMISSAVAIIVLISDPSAGRALLGA